MRNVTCILVVCALLALRGHAASTDPAGGQQAVELRDGSRVMGQVTEDTLSLHSATMGDIKLPWAQIRAIDFASDSNAAKVTAVNGDSFAVQISADTFHLKTEFGVTDLPVKLIRSLKAVPSLKVGGSFTVGTANAATLRLTIGLWDGSRLVGKGSDDPLTFHSTAMGDLKLPWQGIRSIVYATAGADSAQLTAANGDIYQVHFALTTVSLQTSFGKSDLPVKLIRSIKVQTEGSSTADLVGWWKLDEGSGTQAKDSSSGADSHDGTLVNNPTWTRANDQGDWSLRFVGSNQYVSLGNILQGSYDQISIACWIKHGGYSPQTIVERGIWNDADGIDLGIEGSSVAFGHAQMKVISKASVQDDRWHHVVGTMSKSENGSDYVYSIYVDGKLDSTKNFPIGLSATSSGWGIGAQFDGSWGYQGSIKDVRIYDCALSDQQVEAVYGELSNVLAPGGPSSSSVPAVTNGFRLHNRKSFSVDDIVE